MNGEKKHDYLVPSWVGDELLPLAAARNEQFITGVAFVGPLTFEFVFV